jgi:hypothetical protein
VIPGDRAADRGRCLNSPDHSLNASLVYQIPTVGGAVTRALAGGWQVSGILSARSGSYFTVTSGVDNALTGQPNQRARAQRVGGDFFNGAAIRQFHSGAAGDPRGLGQRGVQPDHPRRRAFVHLRQLPVSEVKDFLNAFAHASTTGAKARSAS